MSNPLLQPYPILGTTTRSPEHEFDSPYDFSGQQTSSGGGIVDSVTGLLTKAGETALDAFGLWAGSEIARTQVEFAETGRQNPDISESRDSAYGTKIAGIDAKVLVVGGLAVTATALIAYLVTRKG